MDATLSASLCKELLETGAFSFLQPSLPARLPTHLQRSVLRDLPPNPVLHLGLHPECPATDATERWKRPALISS